MADIFHRLSEVRILVVGDVMLDRYWIGQRAGIAPESSCPVLHVKTCDDRLGGAANVARNISHLCGNAALLGLIGKDSNGEKLSQLLSAENIHSHLLNNTNQPTITKLRILDNRQQLLRLDIEETFDVESASGLKAKFAEIISDYDTVVFSDYDKGSLAFIQDMIKTARDKKKLVLVDPKQKSFKSYFGANYITTNLEEFVAAGGEVSTEKTIIESARNMLINYHIDKTIVTRSDNGMMLVSYEGEVNFASEARDVVDVNGAGDTAIASLAVFLTLGITPEEATKLSNKAAGIVVGKFGTSCVSPKELF